MPSRSLVLAALVTVALVSVGAFWFGFGGTHEHARVTITDGKGTTLGMVSARVADTPAARYKGLSGTSSLANGSGMWFVFDGEANRTFVMRDMNYPLDLVFVGANGRITAVFHAPTEPPPYHAYKARAKWVLEVPEGWTTAHGVSVGDETVAVYAS